MASTPPLLLASEPRSPELEQACGISGDQVLRDVSTGRFFIHWSPIYFPASTPIVQANPELFSISLADGGDAVVDPRKPAHIEGTARVRTGDVRSWEAIADVVRSQVDALKHEDITGIVLRDARSFGTDFLSRLIDEASGAGLSVLVGAEGLEDDQLAMVGGRIDGFLLAAAGRTEAEMLSARERLRLAGPLLLEVDATEACPARIVLADGIVGHGLDDTTIATLKTLLDRIAGFDGEARLLSSPAAPVAACLRCNAADLRSASEALLLVVDRTGADNTLPLQTIMQAAGLEFGHFEPLDAEDGNILEPDTLRAFRAKRTEPILAEAPPIDDLGATPRLVLESITPFVEGGRFPIKRVVGEAVTVESLLYGDGHEQLAAELQWRAIDAIDWQVARMERLPNDAWRAKLTLDRIGRHEFAIEGWLDRFGSFQRDFGKKRDAGVAIPVDYTEGRLLVERAQGRADSTMAAGIAAWLTRYDAASTDDDRAALLLGSDIATLMDAADDRSHSIRSTPQWIDAERLQARYSSWYELFPRSQTDDPARHGTFADVIDRLPAIRGMGFDTLYFPPIHPIGMSNRKGPNNTLTPGPEDVGSPYAIGSADGGHDSLHPQLGSFEDFERLVAAAAEHGLEIAIDFAIQCSPDHPWLKDHPGWFDWRPDGTIKYAENPPKKYQDIVNVDFYAPDAVPDLWLALRDVVLLWIDHGVKTFRVDNPHTKPLPFWEWMIGDVRARHPDAIFLAEAFTRPNMMYRLAKIGFSQSYTYFTWRDGKQELIDYVTELTTTAPKDFYRPHFFVNTPDINPPYLQTSGRAGFRIRAVLAATLSGLFGVYSGFELCEAAAVPGKEEYLDSEKYEIRVRDWKAPGNIIADITLLNCLRRTHPALQTHLNTRFYVADNDNVIYYGKLAPDGSDMILVMVNLDPHQAQETRFEVPFWEFGLSHDGTVSVEDLSEGHRFDWRGKDQMIQLDPQQPYRIWRIWSTT